MKKLLRSVVLAVAVLIVATGLTSPAHAATRQYVSKAEFAATSKGMLKDRVHRIFGDNGVPYAGKQTFYFDAIDQSACNAGHNWGCAEQDREYRTKSSWGTVEIDYIWRNGHWRVTSRTAYWG